MGSLLGWNRPCEGLYADLRAGTHRYSVGAERFEPILKAHTENLDQPRRHVPNYLS